MKKLIILTVIALMFVGSQSILAQNLFSVEVRGGVSFATQDLDDADLKTGFGFEGIIDYEFMPYLSVYTGWGWNQFKADESFAGKEANFDEMGFLLGIEYDYPFGESIVDLYVRAGGIYNYIKLENEEGTIDTDSDYGLGWRAEVGVEISLGSDWHLKPGIKYQSLSRDIDLEVGSTSLDLTYLTIGVGITKTF